MKGLKLMRGMHVSVFELPKDPAPRWRQHHHSPEWTNSRNPSLHLPDFTMERMTSAANVLCRGHSEILKAAATFFAKESE